MLPKDAGSSAAHVAFQGVLDALRAVIRDEVRAALAQAAPQRAEWMTADEVAATFGFSRKYVSELVRRHGLPAHQPGGRGGRQMFRRSEVEAWVARRAATR